MSGVARAQQLLKAPTGIEGFDEITGGGLPRERTTLLIGGAGGGKTVFGLQTLVNGARLYGEPGIFVAFEETSSQIVVNALSFGWDLPELQERRLFLLDARMSPDTVQSGRFDLSGMLASIGAKADQMGAKRIVFDSIDVLLTLLGDPAAARAEVYRVRDWLMNRAFTAIITARTEFVTNEPLAEYGFLPFMADCVVRLQQGTEDRVSLRKLRVVKYRGSGFAENEFPMVIGKRGIEVASLGVATAEFHYRVSTERVSTGVERLDAMLGGGYYRSSSILITGAPGTAKSTLGGAFVLAACERGERALFVSFDEGAEEILRNLQSVGIDLRPHVESGLLRMYSARTQARSAEEHLVRLRDLVQDHGASCVVIDPLSALAHAGGEITGPSVAQRLMHFTKLAGITLLSTSLLDSDNPEQEATPLEVSTIADTWVHLTYVVQAGERNRALSVVKSRGMSHSNQVRELLLSDEGVTLADVYSVGGQVLMGTLRWEREAEQRRERERARLQLEQRRREARIAEAEIRARMEALQHQLEMQQADLEGLRLEQEDQEAAWRAVDRMTRTLRYGDAPNRGAPGQDADADKGSAPHTDSREGKS